MRAQFLILLTVASTLTVFVSVAWSLMGVWAKWRRGALKLPAFRRK